jgi:outer membrane immunogenic protein
MKKILLSCAVACAAVIGSINQTFAQENNRIGIKAGVSMMTLGSSTTNGISINYDYRPGLQIGLFGETPLSKAVTFSPQVLFTQKGGNAKATISGITFDYKSEITYLDIPFLFGFKPQPSLTFFVGPQVSFISSQKTTMETSGPGIQESQSSTGTEGLRKVLFGGNIGAGYNFNKKLGINLNYIFDFNHTFDGSVAEDTGEKNSGFVLSVSCLF